MVKVQVAAELFIEYKSIRKEIYMDTIIYDKAKQIITEYLRLEKDEIHPDTHLVNDLGVDSLSLVELAFRLSEAFSIKMIEADENRLIFKNLIDYIEKQKQITSTFPEFIANFPEVDMPMKGIRGKFLQAGDHQVVFWNIDPMTLPPHKHGAQYGIIVEGEMTLVIGEERKFLKKGDELYIPAGVEHYVIVHSPLRVVDFFAEPNRVKAKKS